MSALLEELPKSGLDSSSVNRQIYENSPLAGSSIEAQASRNPDLLFNQKKPNLAVIHEKAEHRLAIILKARGMSQREIAHATGYTEAWVSQILRQPWARERLLEEIRKGGADETAALLHSAATDSVFKIIELRDTSSEDSVRLRAAQDLLDRHLGKATQRVESHSTAVVLTGEVENIDKELARLREAEARLLGTPTAGAVITIPQEPVPEEPAWTEARDRVSTPPPLPSLEDYQ